MLYAYPSIEAGMKELKIGLNISDKGMEFFGSDELNSYIYKGWAVKRVSPNQAFVKENTDIKTDKSESFTFAGYEMIVEIEHKEISDHFSKASDLSKGLLQFDTAGGVNIGFNGKRKLKKAIGHYDNVIVIDPSNAGAYLLKAKCHESLDESSEAVGALENAIQIEPYNEILYCEIGAALMKQRDFVRAIELMEQGVNYFPEEARILSNLGLSYLFTNMADKAVKVYDKLIEIEPEYELNKRFLAYSKRVLNGELSAPQSESDIAKSI